MFTISNHLPGINSDVPAPGLSMFQSRGFWTKVCFSRKLLFSPTTNSSELQRFCYSFTSSSETSNESFNSKTIDDFFTDKICFRTILLHFDSFLFEQLESHLLRINWPQTCPLAYFGKIKSIQTLAKTLRFFSHFFWSRSLKIENCGKMFFFCLYQISWGRCWFSMEFKKWKNGNETFCYFFWCQSSKICKSLCD